MTLGNMRRWPIPVLACGLAVCQEAPFVTIDLGHVPASIRGGALTPDGKALLTWGAGLHEWPLASAQKSQPIRILNTNTFGEGGCLADVTGSRRPGIVLEQLPGTDPATLGQLVWLEGPDWRPHLIDDGIEMSECVETNLFGRRGILLVQRHAQVRFYPYPLAKEGRAEYQEVYSFYTPSRQAGLLQADIDGDGLIDILCGNYWIRSPAAYDLPWHLFAIELYNETPRSASLRLAMRGGSQDLFVAQRDMAEAKVTWFRKLADPKVLWEAHPLNAPGGMHFPTGLLAGGWSGEGTDVLVGERNGAQSRLLWFHKSGHENEFTLRNSAASRPIINLLLREDDALVLYEDGAALQRITLQKR